jgi:hypothetical protein
MNSLPRSQESAATPRHAGAFHVAGRRHPALILLAVAINGIMLLNAVLHPADIGYDAEQHLNYAITLAAGRTVGPYDSQEFFCPPLPYLFPAALIRYGGLDPALAAKANQVSHVALSLALTVLLLRIAGILRPDSLRMKLATLLALALVPAYYKSFAIMHGEPWVALLTVASIYAALRIVVEGHHRLVDALALGGIVGVAGLTRQWSLPGLLALGLWGAFAVWHAGPSRPRLAGLFTVSLLLASALAAPFYLNLHARYGSATVFNRPPKADVGIDSHPISFYTGLGGPDLFQNPIRNAFRNQAIPMFYADLWGDWWGYFLVYGRDARSGQWLSGVNWSALLEQEPPPEWLITNRDSIAPLLGSINQVSLFPTLLAMVAGLHALRHLLRHVRGRLPGANTAALSLIVLMTGAAFAAYVWFLVRYPNMGKGDTVKAGFMVHTIPCAALLVGALVDSVGRRHPRAARGLLVALLLVYLHNLPAMVTRFATWEQPRPRTAQNANARVPVSIEALKSTFLS